MSRQILSRQRFVEVYWPVGELDEIQIDAHDWYSGKQFYCLGHELCHMRLLFASSCLNMTHVGVC